MQTEHNKTKMYIADNERLVSRPTPRFKHGRGYWIYFWVCPVCHNVKRAKNDPTHKLVYFCTGNHITREKEG